MEKNAPVLTRNLQNTLWRLADAVAKSLREPSGENPGDSRWTVEGLGYSSWRINHPDIEILDTGDSPLIFKIKKIKDSRWSVLGQNQLKNLINTKVVAIENSPPSEQWDVDAIAKASAQYFQEQLQALIQLKEEMTPNQPPGAGPIPQEGSAGPNASRRASATLSNLRKAQLLTDQMNQSLTGKPWFHKALVANSPHGISVRVILAQDKHPLKRTYQGIPLNFSTPRTARKTKPTLNRNQDHLAKKVLHRKSSLLTITDLEDFRDKKLVWEHLQAKRRPYTSVKYMSRNLGIEPERLARILGRLISEDKIDIVSGYFRPKEVTAGWGPYKSSGPDKDPLESKFTNDTFGPDEEIKAEVPRENTVTYERIVGNPSG